MISLKIRDIIKANKTSIVYELIKKVDHYRIYIEIELIFIELNILNVIYCEFVFILDTLILNQMKLTFGFIIAICNLCLYFSIVWAEESIDEKYHHYLSVHKKNIKSKNEYDMRIKIFEANLKFIKEASAEEDTHEYEVNKFADMTDEEYQSYLGYVSTTIRNKTSVDAESNSTDITQVTSSATNSSFVTIDWRDKGAVNPIQDQGQWGSCWAFSATAAFEGAYFIKHGVLMKFSEKQLVDCSKNFGNSGCNGGWEGSAFDYLKNNSFCTEAEYPYKPKDGKCQASTCEVTNVKTLNHTDIKPKSGDALRAAVDLQPVSVALHGGSKYFQLYKGGILQNKKWGNTLDHAVVVVGYGTDEKKGDYWIVRNSWGTSWGEKGYIRISAKTKFDKKGGICGILLESLENIII